MKKKELNRLRAIDEAAIDGLHAHILELDEKVAGLVKERIEYLEMIIKEWRA